MISPLQAHLNETLTSLKFATKVRHWRCFGCAMDEPADTGGRCTIPTSGPLGNRRRHEIIRRRSRSGFRNLIHPYIQGSRWEQSLLDRRCTFLDSGFKDVMTARLLDSHVFCSPCIADTVKDMAEISILPVSCWSPTSVHNIPIFYGAGRKQYRGSPSGCGILRLLVHISI